MSQYRHPSWDHSANNAATAPLPSSITPPDIFFTEFASVLESLVTRNTQLLIIGDFNIHLEDPSLSSFLDILSQFDLCQHVTGSTHKAGHTLDLVITSDEVVPDDLKVLLPTISDEC